MSGGCQPLLRAPQDVGDREPRIGGIGLNVETGLPDLGEYGAAVDLGCAGSGEQLNF